MNEPAPKLATKPRGLRRRHVLVGVGAAAGGLAITKALGLYNLPAQTPGQTQSPTVSGVDWISPLDKPEAQVAHLLRRATFGATPAEYQQSLKDGFRNTVDRLLETKVAGQPTRHPLSRPHRPGDAPLPGSGNVDWNESEPALQPRDHGAFNDGRR